MKRVVLLGALVVAGQACSSNAKSEFYTVSSGITAAEIEQHIKNLSHDSMEGRGPATPGGEKTEKYLVEQLTAYGLEPGYNGSYLQPVPIDMVTPDPASVSVKTTGKVTTTLTQGEDVVVWPGSASTTSASKGELVFIGYGADAPEYNWDDFKGVDLKGKVLMVLVNDPPAPADEPDLFAGKGMTYYGRWTYKFEEAERRGAVGMFVVHNTEDAGYGWNVVQGNAGPQLLLPPNPGAPAPLGVRGWMQNDVAKRLVEEAGLKWDDLLASAKTREFKPVSTGIDVDMSMKNTTSRMVSNNVVAVIPGSDPELSKQYVAYSAHWDHLGVGPAVDGDSIYNGAYDNASGTANLLAIAKEAAAAPEKPKRSQVFIFVTAEESGLLGSLWYGKNPTVPTADIIAVLNVDGGNVLGFVEDLTVQGDNKSSLGPLLAKMIEGDKMTITPDQSPEKGYFYRSDHFSFAKVGIPAVSIGEGRKFVGKPASWGDEQADEYTKVRYHQPQDEYSADWDLRGAAQLADIVYRFGKQLANAVDLPVWNDDAEFKALREKDLNARK